MNTSGVVGRGSGESVLRIAMVLPETGSDGQPVARPVVDATELERIAGFLTGGQWIRRAPGRAEDRLDSSRGRVVPMVFVTDGEWIWSRACEYYLRVHGVVPESDFLDHIRSCGYVAAQPDRERALEALEFLRSANGGR